MSGFATTPLTQMTFPWFEGDQSTVAPDPAQFVRLGIPIPKREPNAIVAKQAEPAVISIAKSPVEAPASRRGRTEHISDLLLVVLDRYGISPDEFLSGMN